MEILIVLALLVLAGFALKKAFAPKISEAQEIYFSVVDDMHHGVSIEDMKERLMDLHDMDDYESSMVVAAAVDGEMEYAVNFLETFLKKVEK